MLALAAFASIILADPNFRRPIYPRIRYPGQYYGRLYGRQVDPTAADLAEDIRASVIITTRPIPGIPAAVAPVDLPAGLPGVPGIPGGAAPIALPAGLPDISGIPGGAAPIALPAGLPDIPGIPGGATPIALPAGLPDIPDLTRTG
jgi:hypothetical protein